MHRNAKTLFVSAFADDGSHFVKPFWCSPTPMELLRSCGKTPTRVIVGDNVFSGNAHYRVFAEIVVGADHVTSNHIVVKDNGIEHKISFEEIEIWESQL